ncbi:thioesterase domain-containing protein [Streptomyces sp. NPDC047315]|uniref:thioesterase II family protein n=1 Tax=Streptomyces sp. NPDC047315 TaxID=3155142 RepID=UPI0033CA7BC1
MADAYETGPGALRTPPALTLLHDPPEPELDLVVMPFAGGGPSAFNSWVARIRPSWRLAAVCLPGRGARFTEPFHTDSSAAAREVADAVGALRRHGAPRPLVYFGHSLGARLARDVAALAPPELLGVAGCSPDRVDPAEHARLDDAALERMTRAAVRATGLADAELLAELVELTLPAFRADLALYAGHRPPTTPLACDVVAYYGERDEVPARPWTRHTTGRATVVRLPGDHYVVQRAPGPLVTDLGRRLDAVRSATSRSAVER